VWKQAPHAVQPPEVTVKAVAVSQDMVGAGVGEIDGGGVWVKQISAPVSVTELSE
jgi:hypothetical protein